ncbi:unnamed protein product, partial [Pelagomonas calceolata]
LLQLTLLPAAALELVLPGAQRRLLVEGDRGKIRLRDLAADVPAAVQIVEVAVVRAPVDDRRDLRHGAARHLTVVAAVGVLEHELKLVRVFPVARHVIRRDDVADGRRQFVGPGVVRVHPPILASDAGEHLVFHGLAGGIKPHGRARPGVNDRIRLGTYIEPALDGRRPARYVHERGEELHC